MSDLKPNFDRSGKVQFSFLRYILTLGGTSVTKGLMRWFFIALCKFPNLQHTISILHISLALPVSGAMTFHILQE